MSEPSSRSRSRPAAGLTSGDSWRESRGFDRIGERFDREIFYTEITSRRFGHSVQVCSRPAPLPGDEVGDFVDRSWLVMNVDPPRWRPTYAWAHRLSRRLVRKYEVRQAREMSKTQVHSEGTS